MRLSKNFTLSEITKSNTAKRLGIKNVPNGGSNKSQHCKGQAVDIQFFKKGKMCNKEIYDWVIKEGIEFDQMINEFDYAWIHISLRPDNKNRKMILEAYKDDDGDTAYKVADV